MKGPYHLGLLIQCFISLFSAQYLSHTLQVHVGNGVLVFLFGLRTNRGHLGKITRTVDVDSPCLTGLVLLLVRNIGTEYLVDSAFEGKGNK